MRLSKKDSARLAELRKLIEERKAVVVAEAGQVAQKVRVAVLGVNMAIQSLNETIGHLNELIQRVGPELEEAYDEKSDRWRESDAGQAAAAMVESWAGVIDVVPLVAVLEPDLPDVKRLMTEVYNLEEESES